VGKCARRDEVAEANARLGPLAESTTDSHKVLTALLGKWPERADDPMRAVARGVDAARDALAELDDRAREHLDKGRGHQAVGAQVVAHLDELDAYLGAASAERPITRTWVAGWNKRAQELIAQMISRSPEPVPGPPPPPPPPPPERVLHDAVVNLGSKSAVGDLVATVKAKLDAAGRGRVRVTIIREDD
jgi:hypothetical protein